MSDKVEDNDPEADAGLMREPNPRLMRGPRVSRHPCDDAVVAGAVGVLVATAVSAWARGDEPMHAHGVYDSPRKYNTAMLSRPGKILRLYERGDDQPPRAIKVMDEANGKEIFLVWTSVIVKNRRQFQWTSRGYQNRRGGYLAEVAQPDGSTIKALVLRWLFTVRDPFVGEVEIR